VEETNLFVVIVIVGSWVALGVLCWIFWRARNDD
jgi:hypothetical protein